MPDQTTKQVITKSIAAGIAISIGGYVFLTLNGGIPGALFFSVGLLSVCVLQMNLYTGKVCYIADNRTTKYALNLLCILCVNAITAVIFGIIARISSPQITEFARMITDAKLAKTPIQVIFSSIICNILIYLAVQIWSTYKNTVGLGAIILCVSVFILVGAEHCIANFFYFSVANNWTVSGVAFFALCITGNTIGGVIMRCLTKDE